MTSRGAIALWIALLGAGCSADSASSPASTAATLAPPDDAPADNPTGVAYVQWRDTAFTVVESAEADALFEDVTRCTSEEYGFAVDYPASWHTNEGGQAPGCSWFGPEPFARAPAMLVAVTRPDGVPIGLNVVRTALGQIPEWPQLLNAEVVIDELVGHRTETLVPGPVPELIYGYSVWLDPDPEGLKFMAGTTSAADGDYVLNKAVLDRMLTTLEIGPRSAPDPAAPNPPYVEREGHPFTVIESAEADALFATPDSCTNPVAGYTVTYPDAWYTNTEIGDWPACTWFSPTFYEVGDDPNEVPPEVAIVLTFAEMSFGHTDEPEYSVADQLTVDRFAASRAELIGHTGPNGIYFPIEPLYWYIVTIEERPGDEPTVYARTDFEGAADYVLNKAVLDRIMALIVFDE